LEALRSGSVWAMTLVTLLVGEGLGDHGPCRCGGQSPPAPALGDLVADLDDAPVGWALEAAPADELRRVTRDEQARTPR
jgi:hypothetical protein